MAVSKRDRFTVSEVQTAAFARAVSHPARIAILKLLAERKTCACGEMVEAIPLAQATVSQHLKALREAGLIRGRADGPRSYYSLDPRAVRECSHLMELLCGELRHAAERDANRPTRVQAAPLQQSRP